jgi:triphosphatase
MGGGRLGFEDDLRWLQDKLGAVRDWDVFRESALEPVESEAGDVALVEQARAKRRAEAYDELCAALNSPQATSLWLAITRWLRSLAHGRQRSGNLDRPVVKYARRELRRRTKKLEKRGGRITALEEAELHKLRIGAKKLRYAAEFFRDLYPKKRLKRSVKRLTGLQDLLGEMNDACTARNLLGSLYHRRASDTVIPLVHGAGIIEGATLARTQADRSQLKRQWRRYEKARAPWR